MKAKVTGHKFFVGNIDQKDIDSGRVFVEMSLNEANGREKGTCTVEFKVPNAECIKRIAHLPLPSFFELETQQIADGKGGFRTVVMNVLPIDTKTGEIGGPRPIVSPAKQAA